MNISHRHVVPALAWSVTATDEQTWPQRRGTAVDEQAAWSAAVTAAETLLIEHGLPEVRMRIAGELIGTYAPGRDVVGRVNQDAVRAGLRDMQRAAESDLDLDPLMWLA